MIVKLETRVRRVAAAAWLLLAAAPAGARAQESYPNIDFGLRLGVDYFTETVSNRNSRFENDKAEISSIRLSAQGDLSARAAFTVQAGLTTSKPNWQEVNLTTRLTDHTSLVIGQTRITTLGNLTSTRATSFIERGAYSSALGLNRQMMVMLRTGGDNWTAAAALFDDNINSRSRGENGFTLRATSVPLQAGDQILHLGVWMRRRDRDTGFRYNFRDTFDVELARSGDGFRARTDTTTALEAAWVRGPVTLQSELAQVQAESPGGRRTALYAGYVSATWIVTGGSRAYDRTQARFGAPTALAAMAHGGGGVVDVGMRYDRVELASLAGDGGYSAWMFGGNWYATPKLKLAATYTVLQDYDPRTEGDADLDKFQVRAQYEF